ncbi:MAG: CPBP family intramembrane metalloprotease [Chitinophagales bacterium]|nr:CPBP family intramembrane metalloprotease [Chitinophagales bacterium]
MEELKSNFNKYPYPVQLILLFVIFGFCFFGGQLLAGGIMVAAYGLAVIDIKNLLTEAVNLHPLRFAQMITTLVVFLLPAMLFSKLTTNDYFDYPKKKSYNKQLLFLIPLLIISFYPLLSVVFEINKNSFFADWLVSQQEEYKLLIENLLSGTSVSTFLINFLMIAILPAIAEEWFFRGTLQEFLSKKANIHFAIIWSAIVFSLIHFEFSGFLPRIALGVLLGYIYYFSGNIWLAVLAHLFNNGMEVLGVYLGNIGVISKDLTGDPTMPSAVIIITSTIAFAVLMMLFYKIGNKKSTTFVS